MLVIGYPSQGSDAFIQEFTFSVCPSLAIFIDSPYHQIFHPIMLRVFRDFPGRPEVVYCLWKYHFFSIRNDPRIIWTPPPGLCAGNRLSIFRWAFIAPLFLLSLEWHTLCFYFPWRRPPNLELVARMESESWTQHP